jgi:hypothetical protein
MIPSCLCNSFSSYKCIQHRGEPPAWLGPPPPSHLSLSPAGNLPLASDPNWNIGGMGHTSSPQTPSSNRSSVSAASSTGVLKRPGVPRGRGKSSQPPAAAELDVAAIETLHRHAIHEEMDKLATNEIQPVRYLLSTHSLNSCCFFNWVWFILTIYWCINLGCLFNLICFVFSLVSSVCNTCAGQLEDERANHVGPQYWISFIGIWFS